MRKFMVVLDDSRECLNAMRFAALRAAHTGGGVQILSIIRPEEFQGWIGVADLMRAEARERIEAHFEVFAKWMRDKKGVNPELVIREGDPAKRRDRLGRILDVDGYLRHLAIENILVHGDGYSYRANNYRVYEDPSAGKFTFILHGMDN